MSRRARPPRPMRALVPLFVTLRGRLVLLVCLATLPAILFTFYMAHNERSAALDRMEQDAYHLAGLAAREHAHQIAGARSLLQWLGGALADERGASLLESDPPLLPALLVGHPQLANIGVLDRSGRVVTSAYPAPTFTDMHDNSAFVAALRSDDVATGTYVIGPIVGRPVLNLAYAVRSRDGEVRHVVFNAVDLRWLAELAEQVQLPAENTLLIADRDGRVLAHSGAPERATGALVPGLAALARGSGGRMLDVGGTGAARYFVAVPMGGVPDVIVAVGMPQERIAAEANRVFYRTLGGLALLTLFTMISVLVAAELSVLRTIRALSSTSQRFGRGELSARALVPRAHGELRELANAFNAMADALAARHREATEAHERLRALANHLQVAREAEGARIARELHDEVGQVLTSLKLDVTRMRRRFARAGGSPDATRELELGAAEMSEHIESAVEFVRRISSELRPTVLDRLGLAAALEWQARELEARAGLTIAVEIEGADDAVDPRVATTVFRIAQEALTNVTRHARATTVRVHLAITEEAIALDVDDDGAGIDEGKLARADSLGIIGMHERALAIGGTLTIHGEPGAGTTVSLHVPRHGASS